MTNSPIKNHTLVATLMLSLLGSSATLASANPDHDSHDHHDHGEEQHSDMPTANFAAFDESVEHSHDHAEESHGDEDDEHNDHDDHEDGHGHDDHGSHGVHGGHDDHADETKTTIDSHQLKLAGVKTATAGPQILHQTEKLFGVIAAPEQQVYRLNAPYPSLVEKIHVKVGDRVKPGQVLATLRNVATLQSYSLKSPSSGEVTARPINAGERVDMTPLLTVTDLSEVWVEMSAFPEAIEKLEVGQSVEVNDLHKHDSATATITYISPQMTGGHIARARATIANPDGHWRPGMHVKAAVTTAEQSVAVAVQISALQNFRDQTVVFERQGNSFEARPLETGERDDNYIEVLSGLEAGSDYVTENSFLIKADILKSGAAHVH